MPVLTFLCPTTRKYFDSGVRVDERSATMSRLNIVRVTCPQCRREHRFLLADGLLESPDPQPSTWAMTECLVRAKTARHSTPAACKAVTYNRGSERYVEVCEGAGL